MASHDIILPPAAVAPGIGRSKLAAYVPITLAILGVAAVLLGGISARTSGDVASVNTIDPITTAGIATPDDQRRALEMLDR